MNADASALRAALAALGGGDPGGAERALRSLGAGGHWALLTLRHALELRGHARAAALKALAGELRRALAAGHPAPLDGHRLAALTAQNHALYMTVWERLVRWASATFGAFVQGVFDWLNTDHHLLIAAGIAGLAIIVWAALRFGGLLPRGAGQTVRGTGPAQSGPAGLWREAQDMWRRGERQAALARGRSAVIARLDREGLLRAAPGISDREVEHRLSGTALGPTAQAFRTAYAYGRWALGHEDAAQEAWEQLGLLWRAGEVRR